MTVLSILIVLTIDPRTNPLNPLIRCTKLMLFIMNTLLNRLNALRELLIQGVLVDLSHSIVVILVITALFSTPLILGSIKNRVYVAVKAQVEKENNAREITIQQADADVQHNLD
ncbi:MAG: hypothetical protein DRR16_26715, partial [Candidatus Parabeggiatoa sp. nov. 3]